MKILTINCTDITQIGGVNFSVKSIEEEYNWDDVAEKYGELFRRVIKER